MPHPRARQLLSDGFNFQDWRDLRKRLEKVMTMVRIKRYSNCISDLPSPSQAMYMIARWRVTHLTKKAVYKLY